MVHRKSEVLIHVNQNVIRSNLKSGERNPPITVRRGAKVTRHSRVCIYGQDGLLAAEVVYSPGKPLSCGARVWISTLGNVQGEDLPLLG